MLVGCSQSSKQREHLGLAIAGRSVGVVATHGLGGIPNLGLAGEKHQHIAGSLGVEFIQGIQNAAEIVAIVGFELAVFVSAVGLTHERAIANLDRKGASFDFDNGSRGAVGCKVPGKAGRIDGGRGDDHPQVIAFGHQALEVAEQHVNGQAALVGFVDDDCVVAAQLRVGRNLSQQHAIGEHLQLGALAGLAVETNLVAHLIAQAHAEFTGNTLGDRPGGNAPRLRVRDACAAEFQQHFWQLRGLARAGRAGHNHHPIGGECGNDFVVRRTDGQLGRVLDAH